MTTLLEAAKAVLDNEDRINESLSYLSAEPMDALRQAVQDAEVYTPLTLEDIVKLFPAVVDELAMIRGTERAVIERLGMRWPE